MVKDIIKNEDKYNELISEAVRNLDAAVSLIQDLRWEFDEIEDDEVSDFCDELSEMEDYIDDYATKLYHIISEDE